MTLRYLSVCSGIEAATVAWHGLGWNPVAFSEIEKFPCAVLAQHYPAVPNWGDMTKYQEWPDAEIDLLVGGTPCQSFSVAGLRAGMDDARGNLALIYLGIARRYHPRWVLWENVPGVLSSGGGRDFGAFVGGLAQCGYGFAYRVLDAQWFGVPQRRRRVFVVGYLGDWRRAAAVLFESTSLSGHTPPRREAGERVAATIKGCVKGSGRAELLDGSGDGIVIANTLGSRGNRSHTECDGHGAYSVAPPVTASGPPYSRMGNERNEAQALVVMAYGQGSIARRAGPNGLQETVSTLRSAMGDNQPATLQGHSVRRLTPRECERLQGFDNILELSSINSYTAIQFKGKPAADGPRYKALGNSMAVPVMRWLGERIAKEEEI